jgi:glycosidase
MERIFDQLGRDYELFKLAMVYTLTMRGIPQIYYGTEILAKSDGGGDHGMLRVDFPGGWSGDKTNAFTGEGLSDQEKDAQEFTQKLLNWRKTSDVIHNGDLMHYAPDQGIYTYFRYTDEGKVMVILNKNKEAVQMETARFHEMLNANESGKDIISGKTYNLNESIEVPAQSALILEIN